MAEARERKSAPGAREEQDVRSGAGRDRADAAGDAFSGRDDVRMSERSGGDESVRRGFYGRAQDRRSRSASSSRESTSSSQGFRGSSRGGDYQPEFGEQRGGRTEGHSERFYGGARSMHDSGDRYEGGQGGFEGPQRGYEGGQGGFEGGQRGYQGGQRGYGQRGYEGGHRETSMGGRSDYADYSNEPGWDRNYGSSGGAQRGHEQGERQERSRSRWQREPLSAREIMTKDVRAAKTNSSMREVAEIMRDENTGIVPVVDDNRHLIGVITDRDIVMRSIPEGKDPLKLRASELMTDDVECVTPDESVRDVIGMMGDNQIRRVPVVDRNDRLVGIISMADIATRADYDEELQSALEEISARRSFWSKLFS